MKKEESTREKLNYLVSRKYTRKIKLLKKEKKIKLFKKERVHWIKCSVKRKFLLRKIKCNKHT